MSTLNKVTIIGYLGADPEIITTKDNTKIANLSISTIEKFKSKNNEIIKHTQWHKISVYNSNLVSNIIEKFLHKGSKVYIQGSLYTKKWKDKENNDRYMTEISVFGPHSKIMALDRAPQDQSDEVHESDVDLIAL